MSGVVEIVQKMSFSRSKLNPYKAGVIHPSFDSEMQWIDDFAPEDSGFVFHKIEAPETKPISWHDRGSVTTIKEWLIHFRYTYRAIKMNLDYLVTNFPQQALAASFWKLILRKRVKIVCWSFNIGSIQSRLKGRAAGYLLDCADLLVVHSRDEIETYSAWLNLPLDRFLFVPLQRGVVETGPCEIGSQPFIVSLGSAGRDYRTLFEAIAGQDIRTIVVAKPEAYEGLQVPENVEILNGLSLLECQSLASHAVAGVVPISNLETASGQVSFLTLMALGVPTIVTECPGTRDYLIDGHDAIIVPPGNVEALRQAVQTLWNDNDIRKRLGENGHLSWRKHFSDEAAGVNLVRALSMVANNSRQK